MFAEQSGFYVKKKGACYNIVYTKKCVEEKTNVNARPDGASVKAELENVFSAFS